MRSLPKTGSSPSTSRARGAADAAETPKTPEKPQKAGTAAEQPAPPPLSDKAKAKAIGQKQQSGLMKRAAFDSALQTKKTEGSAAASGAKLKGAEKAERKYTEKCEQLDSSKAQLDKAKQAADAARMELKEFPKLPAKLKELDGKIEEARKDVLAEAKKDPAFVAKERKMWGSTAADRELQGLMDMHKNLSAKVKAGEAPLKEKVKQAETAEKQALHDFFNSAKELKEAVNDYAPHRKTEAFGRSDKIRSEASKLRKEADFLHQQHPSVRVTERSVKKMVGGHEFGKMHSTHKETTVHLPSDVRKIHRTPEQEARKAKDLKEADRLSGQASSMGNTASKIVHDAMDWKKSEHKEIDELVKKYKA